MLNDEILVARWQDLRDLHHQVRDSLVKMSMLNSAADKWPLTVCTMQCVHNSVVLVKQDLIFFLLP